MMSSFAISSTNCFPLEVRSDEGKRALELAVIGVAGVSICLVTLALLSHYQVAGSLNTTAQWSVGGTGAGLAALAVTLGEIYRRSIKPSPSVNAAHIEELCKELAQGAQDPLRILTEYAKGVSLSEDEAKHALIRARAMLVEADFYLEAHGKVSPSALALLNQVRDTLVTTIDSVLSAFGIADFFKPADSAIHSDFKFNKIMMLISLFTLLTATLLPMLGVQTGASIVGGTLLAIAVLSVIWPHVRPLMPFLPSATYWSERALKGKGWMSGGREEVMSHMYASLQAKRHLLLIGPSGIGKTQTAQAFTAAVNEGKYPELQGKKVFYFSMGTLAGSSDLFSNQNSILKRIREAIGESRVEDCILVFDEYHAAYEKQEDNPFGNDLKLFLDSMPYVIGMTTVDEYISHIFTRNPAADRRLDKIMIGNTDPMQTEAILALTLEREVPGHILAEGALAYLIEKVEGKPLPLGAQELLGQCISQISQAGAAPKALAAAKVRTELRQAAATGVGLGAASKASDDIRYAQIAALQEQLATLEQECLQEAEQLGALKLARKRLAEVRSAKFHVVKQLAKTPEPQLLSLLNLLNLLKDHLEPALEAHVKELAAALDVDVEIDCALIDKVIAAEKASRAEWQSAINTQKK